jgi:hypothetical protein
MKHLLSGVAVIAVIAAAMPVAAQAPMSPSSTPAAAPAAPAAAPAASPAATVPPTTAAPPATPPAAAAAPAAPAPAAGTPMVQHHRRPVRRRYHARAYHPGGMRGNIANRLNAEEMNRLGAPAAPPGRMPAAAPYPPPGFYPPPPPPPWVYARPWPYPRPWPYRPWLWPFY